MHVSLHATTARTPLSIPFLPNPRCAYTSRSHLSTGFTGCHRQVAKFSSIRSSRSLRIMTACNIVTYIVNDDGQFPNCSIQNLPVLIYKSAFPSSGSPSELANKIEETFAHNGFPPQWRFGLYEYAHYHSTSHEILGVFKGSARVR